MVTEILPLKETGEEAVREDSAVVAPMFAENVMAAVPEFTVSDWTPEEKASIVLGKVMELLAALVLMVLDPVRVIGEAVEITNVSLVISAPILIASAVVLALTI